MTLSFSNDKMVKGSNKGMMTGMILIDLEKTFNTIGHNVILKKLYTVGFSKHAICWFNTA